MPSTLPKVRCFLAAGRNGAQLMYSRMASEARAVPPDAPDEQVLRAAFLAFLQFLADEPAYARVFVRRRAGGRPAGGRGA
jgi:hypothetical protein